MRFLNYFLLIVLLAVLPACSMMSSATRQILTDTSKPAPPVPKAKGTFKVGTPYKVAGKMYRPRETYNYSETGIASWYGPNFHGKKTANGEIFDMNELTAAHKTLQIPCLVRVTNLENGRSLIVRVNDRGPFKRGRIIDLSRRSSELLGFKNKGVAKVRLDLLSTESKAIAQAAKNGEDTSGTEIALNKNGRLPEALTPDPLHVNIPRESAALKPVDRIEIKTAENTVSGHLKNGKFMPDPVVKQMPIIPNTNIFVQAGSFSNRANADILVQKLSPFGRATVQPTMINGQQFFRVRIGPMQDVSAADKVLSDMANSGRGNALIVVD